LLDQKQVIPIAGNIAPLNPAPGHFDAGEISLIRSEIYLYSLSHFPVSPAGSSTRESEKVN